MSSGDMPNRRSSFARGESERHSARERPALGGGGTGSEDATVLLAKDEPALAFQRGACHRPPCEG